MALVPPPQGMSEVDYAAIEAAVTETVRGRWFLNEFARRNRAAELRQVLDAMTRIESAFTGSGAGVSANAGAAALPPADPSIRLLMQRIKDIAGQLDTISHDMRTAGVDERFADAVQKEARAVSGMMRGPAVTGPAVTGPAARAPAALRAPDMPPAVTPAVEAAEAPVAPPAEPTSSPALGVVEHRPAATAPRPPAGEDPRLEWLRDLDRLAIAEKLALFA